MSHEDLRLCARELVQSAVATAIATEARLAGLDRAWNAAVASIVAEATADLSRQPPRDIEAVLRALPDRSPKASGGRAGQQE